MSERYVVTTSAGSAVYSYEEALAVYEAFKAMGISVGMRQLVNGDKDE